LDERERRRDRKTERKIHLSLSPSLCLSFNVMADQRSTFLWWIPFWFRLVRVRMPESIWGKGQESHSSSLSVSLPVLRIAEFAARNIKFSGH